MSKSSPDRRVVLKGAGAALLLGQAGEGFALPADPPLIDRDYAADRKAFQTHILKRGPAPDVGESLADPPSGARVVAYRSGKLELLAWRSWPQGKAKRPAVLVLHGGNAMGRGHWDLAEPYVKAGYVAMMPSVRGENGQAGIFSGFYDEVDDVLAAGKVLATEADVDPERIFLAGHSVGGTLTMLAAMTSAMFHAASPLSGSPSAFAFFSRFPEDVRFDATNPREFEMRSAVCYATSFKCPTLIQYSSAPARSAPAVDLTADRARSAGLEVESVGVPGDHFTAIPEQIRRSLAYFAERGSGAKG
ncbi:MAG TPA: alpha/beta fold hydrolase [Rhizobiaceae bacterium]|nr:alpha/beta fold hydrolase [Rhizobiaceae bacterium]